MQIGIDQISFYTTGKNITMPELARNNGVSDDKYIKGLGQNKMSIITAGEDIVTMACNAAEEIFKNNEILRNEIDFVIFSTESGVDFSKSAGLYCHSLLKLNQKCRHIEIKQACYSGVMALLLAKNYINENPNSKVLILCSDIAFYGLKTAGEPTQGCGAIAMAISQNPRIATIGKMDSFISHDNDDFFRPIASDIPIVDGKASIKSYLDILKQTFNGKSTNEYDYFCFHMPFAKMAEKAYNAINGDNFEQIKYSSTYISEVGNLYTGSLFLSLISLLDNCENDISKAKVGMFSYGSGSIGEFFSIEICSGYKNHIDMKKNQDIIENSISVDYNKYAFLWNSYITREKSLNWELNIENINIDNKQPQSKFSIIKIDNGKRIYRQNY